MRQAIFLGAVAPISDGRGDTITLIVGQDGTLYVRGIAETNSHAGHCREIAGRCGRRTLDIAYDIAEYQRMQGECPGTGPRALLPGPREIYRATAEPVGMTNLVIGDRYPRAENGRSHPGPRGGA